jgi:hypothetical protein
MPPERIALPHELAMDALREAIQNDGELPDTVKAAALAYLACPDSSTLQVLKALLMETKYDDETGGSAGT